MRAEKKTSGIWCKMSYYIQHEADDRFHTIFVHSSIVISVNSNGTQTTQADSQSNSEYGIVQDLLACSRHQGKKIYKMKWKDCSRTTWEPVENINAVLRICLLEFSDCKPILADLDEIQGLYFFYYVVACVCPVLFLHYPQTIFFSVPRFPIRRNKNPQKLNVIFLDQNRRNFTMQKLPVIRYGI
jgi:hypothetical protein